MCCVEAEVFAFEDLGVEFRGFHKLEDDEGRGGLILCQAIIWLNRTAGVVLQIRMFVPSSYTDFIDVIPQSTSVPRGSLSSTSAAEVALKSITNSSLITVTSLLIPRLTEQRQLT